MTIGTLMALETCQIVGQVSHNLLYWKKKLLTDLCGPGEMARGMQSVRHPSKFPPRTERIRGTIQVKLSFQIDGCVTDLSKL